ncbi:MAG: rubrerythrin family protein [Candidatus Pacebacteria bacterium]|nr:rubrerythrin family protein [Candidatus Paceibacterota bacterium]
MQKTLKNLAKAFIGESQARNRYTFYAKIAKKEGYEQISDIFLKTADNEREHAKQLMKMINKLQENSNLAEEKGDISVEADVHTVLGTTVENLESAINGEHFENSEMYPQFGDIAQEENLLDIADKLRAIGFAEKHHEEVFRKFLLSIKNNEVFKKDKEVQWECRKCGYLHIGEEAPEKCRSCDHPKNYFQVYCG